MKKIRVMFVMGGSMKRAGAETMIMQYLRRLVNDNRFEFSMLVHGYDRGDYDEEITSFGVPIYHVPIRGKHPLIYKQEVKKILKNHPVDIVHCNMDSACGDFLTIAKDCGINNRIAHSHTTKFQVQKGIKKLIGEQSRQKIHNVATMRFACSQKAGQWLFEGDSFLLIKNAVDLSLYQSPNHLRKKKRNELGILDDTFVIGHIGRICYEKNHRFLVQIFAQLMKKRPNSKLLLIGTGHLEDELKTYIKEIGIDTNVMFLGVRSDIPELLQAMDCFVLPSLFEGLPVSGIEAQAAGLPCLFANTITQEICITDCAELLPISNVNIWVEKLENMPHKSINRITNQLLQSRGYDINVESSKLADIYISMVK